MTLTLRCLRSLRFALLALATASPLLAPAQTLANYLKLRHKYGITAAASVEALESFVGTRVVEISGTVHGVVERADGDDVIILERPDGESEQIEAVHPPRWLCGNEIPARLLVSATRASVGQGLRASLLGAADESAVAQIDAETLAAEARAARKTARVRLVAPKGDRARKLWTPVDASQVTQIYAAYIRRVNRRLTPAQSLSIASSILRMSRHFGVDARLIMAIVLVESGFDPASTSNKGAMGLGQLMPGTARWMGVTNAYDTTENLYGTVRLIRGHLDAYGKHTSDSLEQLRLALAAYNAGVGAVARAGGVPPYRETQAYVRKVIRIYDRFCGVK